MVGELALGKHALGKRSWYQSSAEWTYLTLQRNQHFYKSPAIEVYGH